MVLVLLIRHPSRPDTATRTERTVAYRAVVDAAYRQYVIDHSDAQVETVERETATPAVSRTDVEDPERHLVGLADRLKDKGQPAEAARKSPQATDDTSGVTLDWSAPADHDGWMRNLTIGNGDHKLERRRGPHFRRHTRYRTRRRR